MFNTINIHKARWKILGHEKITKKNNNKSADVIWSACIKLPSFGYPLIDQGQQPMNTHTEVTLLYKIYYCQAVAHQSKHYVTLINVHTIRVRFLRIYICTLQFMINTHWYHIVSPTPIHNNHKWILSAYQ